MRIKKADIFPLEYAEPNDDNALRSVTLVRLESDAGIVGWREGLKNTSFDS